MNVAAVVLTWNNVEETVDCVKSLLNLEDQILSKIVVVDNCSELSYLNRLEEKLRELSNDLFIIEESEIGSIGAVPPSKIVLLKNEENYGYAGGNNRGIELLLKDDDLEYVWILNNDTVVDRKALVALVERATKTGAGFTGSVILYYSYPSVIQAIGGGRFFPMLGGARLFYKGKKRHSEKFKKLTPDLVEKKINYIMGASLLVDKRVLEEVGLMDEIFFLYGDELDWQLRATKKGWDIAVALESIVYHRESLSVGGKGSFYFYHFSMSSAIIIKRHYSSFFLPSAFVVQMLRAIIMTGSFKNVSAVVKGFVQGLRIV